MHAIKHESICVGIMNSGIKSVDIDEKLSVCNFHGLERQFQLGVDHKNVAYKKVAYKSLAYKKRAYVKVFLLI